VNPPASFGSSSFCWRDDQNIFSAERPFLSLWLLSEGFEKEKKERSSAQFRG